MIRIAKTENGLVKGLPAADPRITAFKGIPFAAPPVGENRWRAPQPAKNWEGVLEAYQFAPISVQDTPALGTDIYCREWHVDSEIPMGEDCLYLNVWTNAKSTDERLPVMIWYFGGGLQWGYPAEMEFDGERIARRGVVVVTVNYRINIFGFMAHPEITKDQPDTPTNFGNLDQQAGLQWVIRNIAAFGGDPNNITISGQSAGGGSVMSQLTCPANFGSFQRAIVMSGLIRNPYGKILFGKSEILKPQTLERAEKNGEDFFKFVGAANLKEAKEMDAFYLRDKYAEYRNEHQWFATVIDNKFCFGDPVQLFMQNKHAKVDIMAGNTADEFPNMITADSYDEFVEKAEQIYGDKKEQFLAFPEAQKKLDEKNYAPVNGIECTIKRVFRQDETNGNNGGRYYYRFDTAIPGYDNPGTFHSVDLWFFFETLAKCWRPFKGKDYDLARLMCNYMTNFIKCGNPNGTDADGTEMPVWSSYKKDAPCEIVFNADSVQVNNGEEKPFIQFLINEMSV